MRKVVGIICLVLGMGSLAYAEIYKWVDNKGTTHFSDTLLGVPPEYRQQVQAKASNVPALASPPLDTTVARPEEPAPYSLPATAMTGYVVPWLGQRLLVQARLNSTVRALLLVDTGASYTVLSHAVARELALNLQNAAVMPMRSASGMFLAPLVIVNAPPVGEATVRDRDVIIHDAVPGLGGLLGMSFLEHFTVTTTDHALILGPPIEMPGMPTYGGRSKDWWVRKFRSYRQNVETIQAYLAQQSSPQLEKTLRYFQAELNDLERRASVAAVPRQWRY